MAVAIQRTWPKLLCGGDSDKLAKLNVRMRALDMVRTDRWIVTRVANSF